MKAPKIERLVSRFLLSPRYIYRHVLLIGVLFTISLDMVLNLPSNPDQAPSILYGTVAYSTVLIGITYINMYLGIPYLLLKNRLFLYFLSVVIETLIALAGVGSIQMSMFSLKEDLLAFSHLAIGINILSSLTLLCMINAGVTTLVLFKHWVISNRRLDELKSTTLQSELKYLKSQINPHFLFNMLNNANVLLKEKKGGASGILNKLEDILRFQIDGNATDEVVLSADIHFLNDFLNLEKVRRDKFDYSINTSGNTEIIKLPPFLFIPFVENAVKHSQDSERASYVNITFAVDGDKLSFSCENSKPDEENEEVIDKKVGGLGLKNIQRRLELLYPNRHSLIIKNNKNTYIVNLQLELI